MRCRIYIVEPNWLFAIGKTEREEINPLRELHKANLARDSNPVTLDLSQAGKEISSSGYKVDGISFL